jgi:hypothetical protein
VSIPFPPGLWPWSVLELKVQVPTEDAVVPWDSKNQFHAGSPEASPNSEMGQRHCFEITRRGRRAFVLMSAEQYDGGKATGRRAYRTTNAITVDINSVELAEMNANHSALDELLN